MLPSLMFTAGPPECHRSGWPLAVMLLALATAFLPCSLQGQANPQEITSHDVEPTFKLQSERNLVMVRVVVRDAKGAAVGNLRKDDFQIFDHGKLQTIVSFSLEKPATKTAAAPAPANAEKPSSEAELEDETAPDNAMARRFTALFFDDVNTPFDSLARTRDAADHFVSTSVQPGDRVALYTSSGQKQVDFTADLAQIHQALFELRPRPIIENHDCGAVSPYEAYQIVDLHDPNATAVAIDEVANCKPCPPNMSQQECSNLQQSEVQNMAMQSLTFSETQATAALRGIEAVVRRMASLPGQRSVVVVSAGFQTDTLRYELSGITDRALRVGVVINALDARGLYTSEMYDASHANIAESQKAGIVGQKALILTEEARRQTDGIREIALDTGGVFFDSNNNLEEGFRKTAAAPDVFYLLAFSPQNLKHDGSFHPIKVKLVESQGLTLQARRGYFAPQKETDQASQEKEEIREAIFSQDETHELPIDVHTQFFMKAQSDARITVLTHLDLRSLHFRKEADRNVDNLTFVSAVFDQDGHQVSAQEKTVELHMLDSTLDRFLQSGITMRTSFDVKPGTYMVRSVVRDAESGQISGLNRTVEIPYQEIP